MTEKPTAPPELRTLNLDLITNVTCRFEVGWKTLIGDRLKIGVNEFIVERLELFLPFNDEEDRYVIAYLRREQ